MTYLSAMVAGAGGFIGGHLVKSLIDDGYDVLAVDSVPVEEWLQVHDDAENVCSDLSEWSGAKNLVFQDDEVYNLASNTGGAWYLHINKISCFRSSSVNLNLLRAAKEFGASRYFYASSSSVYPVTSQWGNKQKKLAEFHDFPAHPDGNHGLEKLFSESACWQYFQDKHLETRVGRYFNVYGPLCEWDQGREGSVAALCRKIAQAKLSGDKQINVWGNGKQTRSFIYIDDAVEATRRIMDSNYRHPLNIGHEDSHTIDELIAVIEQVAGISVSIKYDANGPTGVYYSACDTQLSQEILDWKAPTKLLDGVEKTYAWIYDQVYNEWY